MRSLRDMILEDQEKTQLRFVSDLFKNEGNSMLSMIAKRIEKWDLNTSRNSRKPMFLCDWNRTSMGWSTVDNLKIELGDGEDHIDGATNASMFDGFLTDYLSGKVTENDQYILGVFVDRCFIPIPNKETFENIWQRLQ